MSATLTKTAYNWANLNTLMVWIKQFAVAALYVLLGHLIHHYYTSHGIGILWPASGLVLAVVLIGGRRYIWGVLLGSILLHAPFKESFFLIAGISLANVTQLFVGSWLLTQNDRSVVLLNTLRDYLRLIILGGFVASLFAALIAATVLCLAGLISFADYFINVLRWWMGNSLGIVLITPLILAWWQKNPHPLTSQQQVEAVLLVSITFIAGQIIFLGWLSDYLMPLKGFIMLLPVTVIAIRLGLRATTLILTVIAIQALMGASLKIGYFANEIATANLYNYWLYVLILSGVCIALTTYVNELKHKELSLRKSETHLRLSQTSGGIGSWEIDLINNKLLCSDSCHALIGLPHEPTWGDFFKILSPKDRQRVVDVMRSHIKRGTKYEIEYRATTAQGERWLRSVGQVERDAKGEPLIMRGITQDVTERRHAENEIERLAFYDHLTALPNRRLLLDRLKQALASSARSGLEGGLLFIDLDNFKNINDSLGHNVGDLLLQQAAERLTACVREQDTVARLGGDEFVVMLENLSKYDVNSATQLEIIGEKILAAFNQPYQFDGSDYYSTASIGAVVFSDHQQSIDELIKQADIAMYQAKAAGRNALRFFSEEMQAIITARAALEADLGLALADNQFVLYYQLQTTHQRKIIGAEVLIRWQHPQHGLVSPKDFIPLAEETGLILPIGQWVLKTACIQIKRWENHANTQHLHLAVNVSARQFQQANFVEQVRQVLSETAIKPELLKLELTESMMLDDIDDTIDKMNILKKMGVRFSMDDFGTGYSSLAYLTQLPLDQLKIDQSFISNLGVKGSDAVIVQTIIGMANNLSIEVIAEGVETEAQRFFLEQHNCQLCQGYLFSSPVPIEQFERLLQ